MYKGPRSGRQDGTGLHLSSQLKQLVDDMILMYLSFQGVKLS